MQKLLLLSGVKFFENDLTPYLGKSLGELKLANVITAAKGTVDDSYLERARVLFRKWDCDFTDLDLDGKNENELRAILKGCDAVFMNGGNSFYLLKSIRESGFEKILKELLPTGLIYIGASAGSYVACPTIEMATWKHQDKYDHYGIMDFRAMNLVPFLMTAHFKEEYRELLKEKIAAAKFPVKVLNDDQALLVENEKVRLIGKEEEIKL